MCGSGLTCETDIGRCGDCGEDGERCCANGGLYHQCRGGASCDISTDQCHGVVATACSGPVGVNVQCDVGFGCTRVVTLHPGTDDSLEDCADMVGCNMIDEPLEDFHFCGESPFGSFDTFTIPATSHDDARNCVDHTYVDYENIVDGCCTDDAYICGE
jgi:hypothetical protein